MTKHQYTPEKQLASFWNKVNKDGSIPAHMPHLGKCWEWIASTYPSGYGQFIGQSSHRFSWELHNGKIPDGLWVLHKCDNRKCVNPKHLFLGTRQDNADDMVHKNRSTSNEKHSQVKITNTQVLEIRERYAKGDIAMRKLAKEYNIGKSQIDRIVHNQRRKLD